LAAHCTETFCHRLRDVEHRATETIHRPNQPVIKPTAHHILDNLVERNATAIENEFACLAYGTTTTSMRLMIPNF
jgi:hypothetical protein